MRETSRRSFLQLVTGAAASVAAVAKIAPAEASADANVVPARVETVSPPTPDGHRPHPFVGCDLLTLLQARGLMKPCPNCYGVEMRRDVSWLRFAGAHIECSGCGWIAEQRDYELPCPCRECWSILLRSLGDLWPTLPGEAIARQVLFTRADPGFYRVTDARGVPITKYELNAYDVCADRYLHHVASRQIGRVACAVAIARRGGQHPSDGSMLLDKAYQPNGNLVITGWEMVDCYEWQRDGRPSWAPA
jgi:predicted RNA-binding Zn-ribbon protein involved in translation (DUF1610 family)